MHAFHLRYFLLFKYSMLTDNFISAFKAFNLIVIDGWNLCYQTVLFFVQALSITGFILLVRPNACEWICWVFIRSFLSNVRAESEYSVRKWWNNYRNEWVDTGALAVHCMWWNHSKRVASTPNMQNMPITMIIIIYW